MKLVESDATKIRRLQLELRRTKKSLAEAERLRDKYKAEGDGLEIVLREARRRTIPFRDGSGSLNFLPQWIDRYEAKRDVQTAQSWSGQMVSVYGPVEVVIHATGDFIQHKERA